MARRIERLYRGQKIKGLRKPLNRLITQANDGTLEVVLRGTDEGLIPDRLLVLEIKALGTLTLTCVGAGLAADPDAFQYEVTLPQIFTEASRDGIAYVYSDINTRLADGTESQELTPKFIVGEFVPCMWVDLGDSGFWRFMGDGRMWAKV